MDGQRTRLTLSISQDIKEPRRLQRRLGGKREHVCIGWMAHLVFNNDASPMIPQFGILFPYPLNSIVTFCFYHQ